MLYILCIAPTNGKNCITIDELLTSPKKLINRLYELENAVKLAKQRNNEKRQSNYALLDEQARLKEISKKNFNKIFTKIHKSHQNKLKKETIQSVISVGKAKFVGTKDQHNINDVHHLYQSMFMPELKKELETTKKVHKMLRNQTDLTKEDIDETKDENAKIKDTIDRYKKLIDVKLNVKKQQRENQQSLPEQSSEDEKVEIYDKNGRAYRNVNKSADDEGSLEKIKPQKNTFDHYIDTKYFKAFNETLDKTLNRNINKYQFKPYEFGTLLLLEGVIHEFQINFEVTNTSVVVINEHLNYTYLYKYNLQ